MQTTNQVNDLSIQGQGHFHMNFLRNYWAIFNQILYVFFKVDGKEID